MMPVTAITYFLPTAVRYSSTGYGARRRVGASATACAMARTLPNDCSGSRNARGVRVGHLAHAQVDPQRSGHVGDDEGDGAHAHAVVGRDVADPAPRVLAISPRHRRLDASVADRGAQVAHHMD